MAEDEARVDVNAVGAGVKLASKLVESTGVTNALLIMLLVGGGSTIYAAYEAAQWSATEVVLPVVRAHLELVDTLKDSERDRDAALSALGEANAEGAGDRAEIMASLNRVERSLQAVEDRVSRRVEP